MSFINKNLEKYAVKQICKALKFARSTYPYYYKALVRVPSNKEQEYQEFSAEVKHCFEKIKSIMELLRYAANLMKKVFLVASSEYNVICNAKVFILLLSKKYNHKINQGKVPDDKVNVLKEGWTYLASVMDLMIVR